MMPPPRKYSDAPGTASKAAEIRPPADDSATPTVCFRAFSSVPSDDASALSSFIAARSRGVGRIDAVEAPAEPRPRQPALTAPRPLRSLHVGVAAVEDVLADRNQLASARLRPHLDGARGLEVVHRDEGVGDGG